MPFMARAGFFRSLTDSDIDAMLDHMARATSPGALLQVRVLGGAVARRGADETAFGHRGEPILIALITPFIPPTPEEVNVAWVEGFWGALRPHTTGAFASFLDDEGAERVRSAYPPATWERLGRAKHRYDPDNLFRINQNIPPAP